LGANFQEFIAMARYQPVPKWLVQVKLFYWKQGIDSSYSPSVSYGSNIFLSNNIPPRQMEFGYSVGTGLLAKAFVASFLVSYEARQNLFIDLSAYYRKYNVAAYPVLSSSTTVFSIALRLNIARRVFEF
jgi:hypothetical protein